MYPALPCVFVSFGRVISLGPGRVSFLPKLVASALKTADTCQLGDDPIYTTPFHQIDASRTHISRLRYPTTTSTIARSMLNLMQAFRTSYRFIPLVTLLIIAILSHKRCKDDVALLVLTIFKGCRMLQRSNVCLIRLPIRMFRGTIRLAAPGCDH